jgi:hypothetical protein
MAATTASEANALIADATCDMSCLPPGLVMYAILAALIDVGNGLPVPDAQTLASEANCLLCYLSPGMVPYAILQAIRGISSGGGGSGGVTCGAADPVAAPSGTCGLYYRTNDGSLWKWNGAAWGQILGP